MDGARQDKAGVLAEGTRGKRESVSVLIVDRECRIRGAFPAIRSTAQSAGLRWQKDDFWPGCSGCRGMSNMNMLLSVMFF